MTTVIPPEIVDRIIDYLHDDDESLIACSRVARDWVPTTRLHLFAKLSLLSADEVAKLKELDRFAPDNLHYCQELSIGTSNHFGNPSARHGFMPFVSTPPPTISKRIDRLTSLRTLHFRGFPSGAMGGLISPLVDISEKITAITFTDSSLESCYDLWKILRLFPNLENVHVSDLGYSSSREGGLVVAPKYCHSPPIASFSFHTYCQGFVLEQLAVPPYPLTHLKSLEIHHTDQQQHHLNSIAIKYRDAIATLKFSACSTLGSDIPSHIGMYDRLRTLIFGRLELFAVYWSNISSHGTVPSFAWVTATMPYINSRLTRLVFEITVTERRDLNAISWEDIDAFLDAREQFQDLKSVEVVFLDTKPTSSARRLEPPPPGIDLKEDLMRRMQVTVKKGLMRCSTRGLRTSW